MSELRREAPSLRPVRYIRCTCFTYIHICIIVNQKRIYSSCIMKNICSNVQAANDYLIFNILTINMILSQ